MKIQLERTQIGNAFLPKKGIFPICEVTTQFPSAPFVEVRDMDGIRHTCHRNSVQLKPQDNASENSAV